MKSSGLRYIFNLHQFNWLMRIKKGTGEVNGKEEAFGGDQGDDIHIHIEIDINNNI